MAKQVWKPGTLVAPIPPMLVSCGTMDAPNIITAAWCGNVNSVPAKAYVSIRPERYSYDLIKESGEFVLNLPTERLLKAGFTQETADKVLYQNSMDFWGLKD